MRPSLAVHETKSRDTAGILFGKLRRLDATSPDYADTLIAVFGDVERNVEFI
jgi:hypothetical protein